MKEFNVNENIVSLALFTDVSNSRELLGSIQAGTLEPEVALLNASLIPDVFPVLAAAYISLVAKSRAALKTRTIHSELVYNYSGSKHITESLKRCGISDKTDYILAVCFGTIDEITVHFFQLNMCSHFRLWAPPQCRESTNSSKTVVKDLEKAIKGKGIELDYLEAKADKAQIQKHFKITSQELTVSSLSDAITCRIAARDAL